jgi:NhaA family Na+:H+ antiporter
VRTSTDPGTTPGAPSPAGVAGRRVLEPLQKFLRTESASGILLGVAALVALVWANVATESYDEVWSATIGFTIGDWSPSMDLRQVVVDGLMALFFFVVGMEIKRELTIGELAERKVALLPVFAAAGGMVVPAGIFLAVTAGDATAAQGWGIPMATDIAFAVGALSLVSRHVPIQLAAFLLAVAVVDDIGAIAVIALFYSSGLEPLWLGAAIGGLAIVYAMVRLHVFAWIPYAALGVLVWAAVLESGVQPAIAGVAMGLLMPVYARTPDAAGCGEASEIIAEIEREDTGHGADVARWQRVQEIGRESVPMLERFEDRLHPYTSFVVLPLFALSEAGIVITSDVLQDAAGSTVTLGVALGLIVGKTAGVLLGAWIATLLGLAVLPRAMRWVHVAGVGMLAGIGFTVAIFVATLAYDDELLVNEAKIGIMGASVVAAVIGIIALRLIAARDARRRVAMGFEIEGDA